ncbi:MAG TPA: hypothetical protein VHW01_17245 [Polyangiaceae bacterium]|nr:hypothetical protein [Polyangiaceae bacterium]
MKPRLPTWLRPLGWQRPAQVAAGLVWAIAAISLLYRLPYGVSHRDEAFYSAMPYSFLLGNRPYVDELAMHQNAGILVLPFFRVYRAIVGSADGIILFNRRLYFAYLAICSIAAYRLVRRIAGPIPASCVGALVILFAYFNLLALSYNTCGAFGFFCGIVCTASALLKPRPGWQLFGASLCFLSGVFSYPGYAPALLLYLLVVVWWLYRNTDRASLHSGLRGLGAGAAVSLAAVASLMLWVGRPNLERLLAFSRSMGYAPGIFDKLNFVNSGAWPWRWRILGYWGVFLLVPLGCRLHRYAAWVLAPLAVAALEYCYFEGPIVSQPSAATTYLISIPMLAPVCIALNRDWRYGRFVLELIWLPSVLSMLCIAYSSANGYVSSYLGALGAITAGAVILYALMAQLAQRNPEQRLAFALVFVAVCGSLILIERHSLYASVYDVTVVLGAHDTRVRSGPMRGTLSTGPEAARLESIDRDLKSVAGGAKSLTVFDDFATGYLSAPLRPRTFSQWIVWDIEASYAHTLSKETFGTPDKLPDVVLELTVVQAARQNWEPYFRGRYTPVIERPEFGYTILRRKNEASVRHRSR